MALDYKKIDSYLEVVRNVESNLDKHCELFDSDKLAELLNSLQTIVKGLDALLLLGDIDELTRNSILEFKQYGKCSFSKKLCYGQEGS